MPILNWLARTFPAPDLGERRVLAPGRFLWLRGPAWMIAFGVVMIVGYAFSQFPLIQMMEAGGSARGLIIEVLLCLSLILLYAVVVRLCEGRWPSEVAPRPALRDAGLGLAGGMLLLALTVFVLLAAGLYSYEGYIGAAPWTLLALSVVSGVGEEIVMRGIVLRILMRVWGPFPAILLSSLMFGFMHIGNPDAGIWAAVAISLEIGVLFGGVYLLTGRLWAPMGMHAGWNFAQGYLFGADVSGEPITEKLFATAPVQSAPDWLTGGGFGPEASVVATLVCTLAGICALWAAIRVNRLRLAAAPA